MVRHRAILKAGSGDLMFDIRGRTIKTKNKLKAPQLTKIPTIAGLSQHKEEKTEEEDLEGRPKRKLSIRIS